MKKVFFLLAYLLNFFLTFFCFSTTMLGIRQEAYFVSIIFLVLMTIIFLFLTILFYKLYKKSKIK